jgi:hypothetical protein
MGDDDIDADPHEFFGKLLSTVTSPVGIAELDLDVPAFRIPECMQPAPESIRKRVRRWRRHKHPNERQFWRLLRTRRERPHRRRAAKQRNELAPPHSIELHPLPQPRISETSYRIG